MGSLPNSPQNRGEKDVLILLEELGFSVKSVVRNNPANPAARNSPAPPTSYFTAQMVPVDKNLAAYGHPIAAFGTRLPAAISVIELFGRLEPQSIIDRAPKERETKGLPIVLLNGALSLSQRRQLAKLFLDRSSAQNPFILVDWVLLLHLATTVREERLRILLACSLPFTGVHQVFFKQSLLSIEDEMFIGRTHEISEILKMKGPVIVYGGRQLGKTALLHRAKNRFHAPGKNDYGVFLDIKECRDEKSLVEMVVQELAVSGIRIPMVESLAVLSRELRKWFNKPGGMNKRLLLLMDEADKLLAELAKDNYEPLTHLEALSRIADDSGHGFKFVFAGLHNVVRAAKGANTVLGHFGQPLCIKPLSPADAFKLLTRPLVYLGFAPEREPLLLLLVNTIFYPGVVHHVGASFVEMLPSYYSSFYSNKDIPPFELSERQIAALMNSENLTEFIYDRVRLTLEVDSAYFNLARYIALKDFVEKKSQGYTVEEILKGGEEFKEALGGLDREKCLSLLLELCEMSILVKTGNTYRFRLSRFQSIVGKTFEEIWDQLEKAGADEPSENG